MMEGNRTFCVLIQKLKTEEISADPDNEGVDLCANDTSSTCERARMLQSDSLK